MQVDNEGGFRDAVGLREDSSRTREVGWELWKGGRTGRGLFRRRHPLCLTSRSFEGGIGWIEIDVMELLEGGKWVLMSVVKGSKSRSPASSEVVPARASCFELFDDCRSFLHRRRPHILLFTIRLSSIPLSLSSYHNGQCLRSTLPLGNTRRHRSNHDPELLIRCQRRHSRRHLRPSKWC